MGQRVLLSLFATIALLSPSHAFEVEVGQCQRILSVQARVRIHYASGHQSEIDPVARDNVNVQVEVFPDGRRVSHTWIGGMLPLEARWGRVIYATRKRPGCALRRARRGHSRSPMSCYRAARLPGRWSLPLSGCTRPRSANAKPPSRQFDHQELVRPRPTRQDPAGVREGTGLLHRFDR